MFAVIELEIDDFLLSSEVTDDFAKLFDRGSVRSGDRVDCIGIGDPSFGRSSSSDGCVSSVKLTGLSGSSFEMLSESRVLLLEFLGTVQVLARQFGCRGIKGK